VGEFLQVPAYPGSPLSTAVKQSRARACVRACVCVCAHTVDGPEALCLLVVLPSMHAHGGGVLRVGCCHFLVDAFTLLHKRYLQYVKYDGSVTKCCAPLAALSPLGSGAIWQTIVKRVTLRNQKLYESTTLLGNTNINKQICTAP